MLKLKKYYQQYPTLFALFFFVGLTFLFTFPLGIHFGSELPKGGGDTYQAIANIEAHFSDLQEGDFFAGTRLFLKRLGTYSPYVFLNMFLNKYAAYNVMFFLSYILSGLGAYLLAYHFTKRKGASLIAGVLFAFAPFHYYQTVAVHLGSMQQQWIPFAALFLIRFLEKLKFKDYALFLLFLSLIAISEHQLLAFSLLFLSVLVIVKIFQNRGLVKNKKLWMYLGISLLFFVGVAFLVFGNLLKVAISGDNFLDPGSGAAKKYAMKPWEPLLPPSFQAFWPGVNNWLRKTIKIPADWRDSYFVGFAVLLSLGFFFRQLLKRKNRLVLEKSEKQGFKLWLITFLTMYVFSWGPGMKIFNVDLPLPYYLVYKFLPFYENIRVTGRIFMFAMLAISVLTAYAVKYLQPKIKRVIFKKYFVIILSMILMVEFWIGPLRLMSLGYSSFYDQISKEKENYKILEVPGSTDYEFASYKLFTSNIHGKKSVDGMALARSISGQFDWQRTTPVVKQLLYTLAKGNDPEKTNFEVIDDSYFKMSTDILNYSNIRYITLSRKYLENETIKEAQDFIEKYMAIENKYEDQYLVAYKIAQKNPSGFYAKINSSSKQWSIDIKNGEKMAKKAGNGATMSIFNLSQEKRKVTIEIAAQGVNAASFSLAGNEFSLSGYEQKYTAEIEINPGENTLRFEVKDTDGNPLEINSRKKKKEGMLIYNIKVR